MITIIHDYNLRYTIFYLLHLWNSGDPQEAGCFQLTDIRSQAPMTQTSLRFAGGLGTLGRAAAAKASQELTSLGLEGERVTVRNMGSSFSWG